MKPVLLLAVALPIPRAFLAGGPVGRPGAPAQCSSSAIRMTASYTKKDALLLDEEIERRCASSSLAAG